MIGVLEDEGRIGGVRYVDADGHEHTVESAFVVDASGNTGRTYRHVGGERRYSEFFRNLALFGYFEGGKRLPPPTRATSCRPPSRTVGSGTSRSRRP